MGEADETIDYSSVYGMRSGGVCVGADRGAVAARAGIIQGGAASCRAGDLRNDSFTWRGGTPHLLGTEFIANVGAGLLAPGGGGDAGLAAEGGVEVLRA